MRRLIIVISIIAAGMMGAACSDKKVSVPAEQGIKPEAAITEHYWKLVNLHGNTVQTTNRDVHVILKNDGGRVIGSGGCNSLNGTYTLQGQNGLIFGPVAMTEMACPQGMDIEQDFATMLTEVRSFAIQGDSMVMYGDGKVELGRFEAVYLY